MKIKFKVCGIAFRKGSDTIVSHNWVGYTYAYSRKQALYHIQHREGIVLRDVEIIELTEEPKIELFEQLTLF